MEPVYVLRESNLKRFRNEHYLTLIPSINLSYISSRTLLGKLLRLPLRLIPPEMKVPILQSRLRGKWWIVGASLASYWLGSFELNKQRLFEQTVTPGSVVFDIGAHVGFYTLLSPVLVGTVGKVFAFEPVPRNLHYLYEHLRLNQATNVTVTEAAVADACGTTLFDKSANSATGHLSTQVTLCARVVSMDALVPKEIPSPDFLKIDVEGAEWLVLTGARQTLSQYRPTIFLSTHGRDVHQRCCQLLELLGYQLQAIHGRNVAEADVLLAR
jgi:FkbM family methyltransferase